jgi:AraC-like DNA-binding protein
MKYINIFDIGVNQVHSSNTFHVCRPQGLGKWLLLIVKSHACFILDNQKTITEPDTAILFAPDTPQDYQGIRNGENYQDHWMEFEIEEQTIRDIGIPIATPIKNMDSKAMDSLFSLLQNEFYFGGSKKNVYVELYLGAVFEKLSEAAACQESKQDSFHELQRQIYLHPEDKWSVEACAGALNFSGSHFQNVYRNLMGVSFGNDVIRSRVERAKKLLRDTDYSIAQIAGKCGYHSDNYFVRQFKQNTGTTPAKYRNLQKDREE